jgi:hypothetical protein
MRNSNPNPSYKNNTPARNRIEIIMRFKNLIVTSLVGGSHYGYPPLPSSATARPLPRNASTVHNRTGTLTPAVPRSSAYPPTHCNIAQPSRYNDDPFATIARRPGFDAAKIALFLLNPHPKMPDMSLTRPEAADLAAYIGSLAK